jgi:hypothetical protein
MAIEKKRNRACEKFGDREMKGKSVIKGKSVSSHPMQWAIPSWRCIFAARVASTRWTWKPFWTIYFMSITLARMHDTRDRWILKLSNDFSYDDTCIVLVQVT